MFDLKIANANDLIFIFHAMPNQNTQGLDPIHEIWNICTEIVMKWTPFLVLLLIDRQGEGKEKKMMKKKRKNTSENQHSNVVVFVFEYFRFVDFIVCWISRLSEWPYAIFEKEKT